MTGSRPDRDHDWDELLDGARAAGIPDFISPASVGVQLESAQEFMARMRAADEATAVDDLRELAEGLGFEAHISPASVGIQLESADEFIARMKSQSVGATTDEVTALRVVATAAGIPDHIAPADVDIELETPPAFVTRMKVTPITAPADEVTALRVVATAAGIPDHIAPADVDIELETSPALVGRLKLGEGDMLAARRKRRIRAIALAASSVAAVGVLLAGVLQPGTAPVAAAATPALLDYEFASARDIAYAPGKEPFKTLYALADAAAERKAEGPTSGTQHVVTDNWLAEIDDSLTDKTAALIPQITENWLSTSGSYRAVERRDDALAPDGRGLPKSGEWTKQPKTAEDKQPAGSIDPDLVNDLPTKPAALRTALLEQLGCEDTGRNTDRSLCLFDQIKELHRTYVIPAEVDAAMWRLLATEEGFRLLGDVKDRAGREGVGISLIAENQPEFRRVLILDPDDGSLLGSEEILIKNVPGLDLQAPAITQFSATLESRYIAD